MNFTIKKLKTWIGHEGHAAQGDLYIDGKKALFFSDDANGGEMDIEPYDKALLAKLEKHVEGLPEEHYDLGGELHHMKPTVDMFICKLVDLHQEDKRLKRLCKTRTVFALPSERDKCYRQIMAPYSAKIKEHIVKKYGSDVEIVNERFK